MTEALTFDFITQAPFRQSLDADLAEMHHCLGANAHKSVHVIAGSIVEALLIDYLIETNAAAKAGKDPLKLDLAQAVDLCRKEGIISDRAADLSAVIRGYRNLIHPGRAARLNEPQPDAASASIAVNLVTLIIREMATARKSAFGLSADQLLSKIVRDSGSLVILPHLLEDTKEAEKERLLLQLIPQEYMKVSRADEDEPIPDPLLSRLARAFRHVLSTLDDRGKQRVAREFARIVREEGGDYVQAYGTAFFRGSDIRYLPDGEKKMVKAHLLSIPKLRLRAPEIQLLGGVERFLEPSEARKWIDPIVGTLLSGEASKNEKSEVRDYYDAAITFSISPDVKAKIRARLVELSERFQKHSKLAESLTLDTMITDLDQARPGLLEEDG